MKIGIDFGTSFSLPAGLINGAPVTLLPDGEYGIPSVFYYDSEVGVQVGSAADDNANFKPTNVMRDIKMKISTHDDQFIADGISFSKKEIISHILMEIIRVSQQESSRRELISQSIEGAVISVPAAFTERELNFIREAAQISKAEGGAAVKVLGFIREPAAAAIAYFNAPKAEDNKTILVYDLGGGTCDVAVVRSNKKSNAWYEVIDSDMKRVGGRDWDKILVEMIKRKYQEKSGQMSFDTETENKVRIQAIKVKHTLSSQTTARASVFIAGKTHACIITIEEFEKATSELLQSTMSIVNKLVRNCDTIIDYIVCVGGSSNMPQVRKALENYYPEIAIKLFEPAKAIAFGAAIYAEQEWILRDKCKFSYGIRFLDNYELYQDRNRCKIVNGIIKGTILPACYEVPCSPPEDGCTSLVSAVYEADTTDKVYKPEDGTEIGFVCIQGLVNSKKKDRFIVTLQIDKSGLIQIRVVEEKSGRAASAEFQRIDF